MRCSFSFCGGPKLGGSILSSSNANLVTLIPDGGDRLFIVSPLWDISDNGIEVNGFVPGGSSASGQTTYQVGHAVLYFPENGKEKK